MTIVDTTVWIDYLAGTDTPEAAWMDHHLNSDRLGLTDLILCEVLQGVRGDRRFSETREDLLRFEVFAGVGEDIAIDSARNYRILRSKGFTIRKTIDCVIATFCIREGHSLLHNDRDFDPFERHLGLKVIHAGRQRS